MKPVKFLIENRAVNILLFIILTALIFYFDWITGVDFNIYAFYVFPLFVLSLNQRNKLPLLLLAALLIGVLWILEDYHFRITADQSYSVFLLLWNGLIRMLFYGLIAFTFYIIKNQREKLRSIIAEKEILLKEVYHRVKNNIQIVISLLSLENNRTNNKELNKVLGNSMSRLYSMAMIHEKLYKSANLSHISVKEYIKGIIASLVDNYNSAETDIKYELDIPADLILDMDKMIPLGLILNELTMNSIKHAFPAKKEWKITISIDLDKTSCYLHYSDNGAGFNNPVDKDKPQTLGLVLINSFASQLDGNVEIKNNGTEYVLSFKLNSK
jgi:two-component sensor histidine kinase